MAGKSVGGIDLGPGVRLLVDEPDYLYGEGRLLFVVAQVDAVIEHAGDGWVSLRGQQVYDSVAIPRTVQVRVRALRAARAAAEAL